MADLTKQDSSALRESLIEAVSRARAIADGVRGSAGNRNFDAVEKTEIDALKVKIDAIEGELAAREHTTTTLAEVDELNARLSASRGRVSDSAPVDGPVEFRTTNGQTVYALESRHSLQAHIERQSGISAPPIKHAAGEFIKSAITGQWQQAELRQMSEGINVDGGFLVPDALSSSIIDLARSRACCLLAGTAVIQGQRA
ncbi:MAG: hypothetical protein WBE26_05175 [Phycisphaerae bacterium]